MTTLSNEQIQSLRQRLNAFSRRAEATLGNHGDAFGIRYTGTLVIEFTHDYIEASAQDETYTNPFVSMIGSEFSRTGGNVAWRQVSYSTDGTVTVQEYAVQKTTSLSVLADNTYSCKLDTMPVAWYSALLDIVTLCERQLAEHR